MKKLLLSLVVIGLVLGIGMDVMAQGGKQQGGGPDMTAIFRPPSQQEIDAIVNTLNLTEEQHSQMQKINENYKRQVQELMNKYQNARQDLMNALQGNPDPKRVESEIKRVNQTHSAVVDKEAELWGALSDSLSESQASTFWKLFAKNRLRMGKSAK